MVKEREREKGEQMYEDRVDRGSVERDGKEASP